MGKIYVASDHGGFEIKLQLIELLKTFVKDEIIDEGCHDTQSTDYPQYAHKVGELVAAESGARGLLVCGSGIGMSIAANRVPGVRAALCWDVTSAHLSREHNNANVLCLGARLVGIEVLKEICQTWFQTEFEGGRHERRVAAIEKHS